MLASPPSRRIHDHETAIADLEGKRERFFTFGRIEGNSMFIAHLFEVDSKVIIIQITESGLIYYFFLDQLPLFDFFSYHRHPPYNFEPVVLRAVVKIRLVRVENVISEHH